MGNGPAYDWVHGSFSGLQALQGQCDQVAKTITGADTALSGQVSKVVGAGGWSGSAASAFTTAWDQDSAAGAQLAGAWKQIGGIANNLATNLISLETALEQAASQLEAQGVYVNPADGTADANVTAGGLACPSPQVAAANAKLVGPYMAYRAQVMAAASGVRAQAALALNQITGGMLPSQPDYGDPVNGLDAVRGLWAVPTTYRSGIVDKLTEAEGSVAKTQAAAWQEALAAKKVYGNNFRISAKTVENASDALQERSVLEGKLSIAPTGDTSSMLADGDSADLGLTGATAGAVRAIPYIGATVGAGITVWQDRENGESWQKSLTDGALSNGAALAAGVGVAAVIGGGSVLAVAGGVVIGGAVAIGVGDFVHEAIQENWSGDWQAYGFVGGSIHGLGDVASNTGHDLLHLASDLNPF
jgi:uncharacterized protein YukE